MPKSFSLPLPPLEKDPRIERMKSIILTIALASLANADDDHDDHTHYSPANIMNKYDFQKAEIASFDYTRQVCPIVAVGKQLPECERCYQENNCAMSMVGFESRVARADPLREISPTTATTVMLASFIGAPALVVSLCF